METDMHKIIETMLTVFLLREVKIFFLE